MSLNKNRVYKNIQTEDQILGLDMPDFLALIFLYCVFVRLFNSIVFMTLCFTAVYFITVYFKKDKPSGWSLRFIKFMKQCL